MDAIAGPVISEGNKRRLVCVDVAALLIAES